MHCAITNSSDAAFGGARRDEEKSRAKERIYSFRDGAGQWDQRRTSGPSSWRSLQRAYPSGESYSRISHFELDGDGCVAVHPRGKDSGGQSCILPGNVPCICVATRCLAHRASFCCATRRETADGSRAGCARLAAALHRRDPLRVADTIPAIIAGLISFKSVGAREQS